MERSSLRTAADLGIENRNGHAARIYREINHDSSVCSVGGPHTAYICMVYRCVYIYTFEKSSLRPAAVLAIWNRNGHAARTYRETNHDSSAYSVGGPHTAYTCVVYRYSHIHVRIY